MESGSSVSSSVVALYSDIGEMTAGLPLLNHRYIQLDRGAFQGDVLGIALSEGLFWRSRANLGGYGSADVPPGYQMVALTGPRAPQEYWHGRLMEIDSLALASHRTGLEHRAGPCHEALAWLIPVRRYLEEAEALGLEVPVLSGGDPILGRANGQVGRLRAVIDAAFGMGDMTHDQARQALRWFDSALVGATLECLATLTPVKWKPQLRPSMARAARDLMHAHAANPLSMSDLCRQLEVHERTLRHQFMTAYQCCPMEYQLALRLKLVQQRLREIEPEKGAISKAATAYGFWHMGRFTQYYKRLLGEGPSQTLASSRPGKGGRCGERRNG